MLAPKKTKYRKSHKWFLRRKAKSGFRLAFGDFALMAVDKGRITSRQIEAARIAMTRKIKRGGKVWIKIFPHLSITSKPLEVRMGKGKGAVDHYEVNIEPGRILYEMGETSADIAVQALELAAAKLPIKTSIIVRENDPWEIKNEFIRN